MIVEWTPRAQLRLGEVYDFIAADAPGTAAEFCRMLVQQAEHLARFPLMGALLPEDAAYRQLVVAEYRIVYRVAERRVYVVTIVSPGMVY